MDLQQALANGQTEQLFAGVEWDETDTIEGGPATVNLRLVGRTVIVMSADGDIQVSVTETPQEARECFERLGGRVRDLVTEYQLMRALETAMAGGGIPAADQAWGQNPFQSTV